MATQLDRTGAFRAKIIESGVTASKKGLPQFVADFQITQFWCDDKDLFSHFGISEASWVDWSAYDMSILAYLQLIYDKKDSDGNYTGELTPMFYVEQLVEALGWDGTSFTSLGEKDWSNKEVTIWVEENEYNGNVRLQVNAIGAGDASPHRGGVRALDATELKGLDAQFAAALGGGAATTASTAAPAAKAPAKAPAAPKPAAAASAAPASSAPSAMPPVAAPAPVAAAPTPTTTTASSMTKDEAWAKVSAVDAEDEAKVSAWIDAASEVIPDGNEDGATPQQWAALAQRACTILDAPF